ncbi:MAG: AAA family ATPase, partial [Planctomycetaceae bacterium]|nr:AAA family ATPase [Planctomycetaceae bacterium]
MKLLQGEHFLNYVMGMDAGSNAETPQTNAQLTQAEPDEQCVETREPTGLQPQQLARLRESLRQLAEGVLALHEAGKLHRDIKTSNVLVTHEGRVVLLDFGLAAELGREGLHEDTGQHVLGTMAYMSPEQAACQPLSPASDWYSVGVMLYEALTGHLPFFGKGWEILANKQKHEPPRPSLLIPGVPEDLDALCVDLLRRFPVDRPAGQDILQRLSSGQPKPITPTPIRPPRSLLVGRQQHLAILREAFETMQRGRAMTLYIHGRSGAGKSTLVQHFLDDLADQNETVVLAGRCYEQESVPFKAFDAVIDALSRYLRRLPPLEAQALLPRDVQSLARLFPTLRCVDAIVQSPQRGLESPDPQELRRRAFVALRELLARIGDRKSLIVFIDDLQWGDVDSARLLADLLQPPDAPVLLFLGAYRSEDVGRSQFLSMVLTPSDASNRPAESRDLAVEALTESESRELALELLGSRDAATQELAESLARESAGNPFFVYELVQGVQVGMNLAGRALTSGEITLDKILWERVQRLPEQPRRLLEMIAVAGRPIAKSEACHAAEMGADERSALAVLRSGRLLRGTGLGEQDEIETYHDRIRESVVAHLSAETLQSHHRRFALTLEASGHTDPEVLAVHFQGARDHTRASAYYTVAGDQAAEALAFDHAVKLYRLALDHAGRLGLRPDSDLMVGTESQPTSDRVPRRLLHKKLADALANAGRGAEAAQHYLSAVNEANADEALELQRRAAEQFLISGHIDEGLAAFRTVLGAVGLKLAPTPQRALVSLLLRRAELWLRGFRFRERAENEIAPDELRRIDILWSVAHSLSLVDPIRSADFQTRNLL